MTAIRTMAAMLTMLPVSLGASAELRHPSAVVADFDYSDTSGEIRDQTADHARRVAGFSGDVVAGIAISKHLDTRRVPCGQADCSVGALGSDRLIAAAKQSGARYLVYGGIHKASTLVEFLKVDVLDLHAEKVVASKLITFRGDDDQAFKRAAGFVARDLLQGVAIPRS